VSIDSSVLIGESAPMRRLKEVIARLAPARVPVLIEGETGTGKELVAELLHRESGRTGSFVAFNVCALSDSMFEAALFGHTKGAFTGAVSDTLGFLREANGGTAFLDEISGLPTSLQPKLLRAVETGVFRPLGSSRDVVIDFRVVTATNERLDELVAAGRFRADLAHRLRGLVLAVPSLAERVDDIPMLVEHFARRARSPRPIEVAREAMDMLQDRTWPGNVRELRQVVEAALVFSGEVLEVDAVHLVLAQRSRHADANVLEPAAIERQRLLKVLMSSDWDTELAATTLGVHRTTVYRRMRRLGIPVPSTSAFGGSESRAVVEGNGDSYSPFSTLKPDLGTADRHRANAAF
jgi:DNA-binding NtrC family response regulator